MMKSVGFIPETYRKPKHSENVSARNNYRNKLATTIVGPQLLVAV